MKNLNILLRCCTSVVLASLVISCSKREIVTAPQTETTGLPSVNKAKNDTLLNITYETGTLTSGISGVGITGATAADAESMVAPGQQSNYAIAHKVVLDQASYVSSGQPRSESDAMNVAKARFASGDELRYEFSVLLKDWQDYREGTPPHADMLFQAKPTSSGPCFFIGAKRDAIVLRQGPYQDSLINDVRPYINQWIEFRVDVKWSNTGTGYYRVYSRLPGQDYLLKAEYLNLSTYVSSDPTSFGYIKWGLYRPEMTVANGAIETRVAYHDNIRIIKLPLQ